MAKAKPVSQSASSNIIAIASGKGGVGKTWLSITLASLIARSGRSVLLFDGDLGLANVDIQLGLTPQVDLGDVISGHAEIGEAVTTLADGGFDILAGRSGSGTLASLGLDKLKGLFEGLSKLAADYDVVLIDLGAGVEPHVRFMADKSAKTVVVVTDEPTSLTDAYAFIKMLLAENPKAKVEIAVNQAATAKEGEVTYATIAKACSSFLGVQPLLLGVIRKDPKVKDAIRAQTPLLTRHPNTLAASDAAAIAVKLMGQKA